MRKRLVVGMFIGLIMVSASFAADREQSDGSDAKLSNSEMSHEDAADNSSRNSRDRKKGSITAQTQANDDQSLRLTQTIRKNLLSRSDFSVYAKNVKIIADDSGLVTLRGPVRTPAEKDEIGRIASKVAGTSRVLNELEIAPNS